MKTWRRIVLGLIAALSFAVPAKAQIGGGPGVINSITLYGTGLPQMAFNAAGSNYGQLLNPSGTRSTGVWALGFGTSNSANGTEVLSWNTSNQVEINHGTAAGAFSLSSNALLQVNSLADASGNAYYYLAYRSTGWLEFANKGGVLPTISSCGTSPSIASGTDEAGDVTAGTSTSNACTITFSSQPSNIPHCFANDTTQGIPLGVKTLSKSGFTVQGTGSSPIAATDRIDWWCIGHATTGG